MLALLINLSFLPCSLEVEILIKLEVGPHCNNLAIMDINLHRQLFYHIQRSHSVELFPDAILRLQVELEVIGEMEHNVLVVELERAPDRVEASKVFGQQFSSFLNVLWL